MQRGWYRQDHFLPDIYVPCEVCHGKRYNRETLEVKYKGKTISDVLDMTVEEALQFFENIPRIKNKLQTLYDVGLSYDIFAADKEIHKYIIRISVAYHVIANT